MPPLAETLRYVVPPKGIELGEAANAVMEGRFAAGLTVSVGVLEDAVWLAPSVTRTESGKVPVAAGTQVNWAEFAEEHPEGSPVYEKE